MASVPLPRVRTRFFGRTKELTDVGEALEKRRLVAIVGAPGIGKTRLAHEIASRSEDAVWASAAGASTVEELIARVALALGTTAEDEETLARSVAVRAEATGDLLLVIDDLDQVAKSASPVLEACAESSPRVKVLATSRVRVRSRDDAEISLGPLDADAAVDVFLDRAGREAAPRAPSDVARLVDEVDRIPFAIELLAGCAKLLGPRELERRAASALEQRPLLDAIERSYRALTPAAARALLLADVFEGGFSLAAFEAVVVPLVPNAPSALDLLRELVESSLVAAVDARPHGDARFFLYASIRAFARERLGDRAAVLTAGRAYFVPRAIELASAARTEGGAEALEELALESENIARAALASDDSSPDDLLAAADGVLALDVLSRARGSVRANEGRLDRMLALPLGDVRRRARLVLCRAHARTRLGRVADALRDLAMAQRIVDVTGFGDVESELLSELTILMQSLGQIDEGLELLERRAAEGESTDLVLRSVGVLRVSRGDLDEAELAFERALAEAERAGNENHAASILALLAMTRHEIGDLDRAAATFAEARERARALGDRFVEAVALNWYGQFRFDLGDREAGRAAVAEARATLEELGDAWFYRATLGYLGIFAHYDGALDEARTLLADAVDRARRERDHYRLGHFLPHLGAVLAAAGDAAPARAAFAEARELAESSPCPNLLPIALALESFVDRAGLRRRLTSANQRANRSSDVRLAIRLVEERLGVRADATTASAATLTVGEDGAWFVGPTQTRVDLSRRVPLQRLLAFLIANRNEAPREGISSERLVAAGWPGERIARDAALHRVPVAIATLRRLGLGDALLKRSDGYLLDPSIEVNVARSSSER